MTDIKEFLSEIEWKELQSTHKLFVLLDCAQLSNEEREAFQSLDSSACVGLFKGTPDEGLKEVEPLLLDPLNLPPLHGMSWLIQNEKTTPMVVWLTSEASIDQLAQHLRSLSSADLPSARNALLRFYDPRVLHKLMQVMTPDQKALFFTDAQQWWAWHKPSSQRRTYLASTATAKPAEKISLDELQMQALNQMDLDDFVQSTKTNMVLNKNDYPHTQNLSDADVQQHVGEHINKAIAFGFESEEAVVEYLQHVATKLGWAYEEKDFDGVVSTLQDDSLTEDEKLAFLKDAQATVLF